MKQNSDSVFAPKRDKLYPWLGLSLSLSKLTPWLAHVRTWAQTTLGRFVPISTGLIYAAVEKQQ